MPPAPPTTPPLPPRRPCPLRAAALLVLSLTLTAAASAPLHAQSAALAPEAPATEWPKKELSEKTSAGFTRLKPLIDTKDYAAGAALLKQLLADTGPKSFDTYVLSQIQAQVFIAQNRLPEAVAPLERALILGEGNPNFLDPATRLEQLYLLAQLHYQIGAANPAAAAQRRSYEKALAHLERWLALSPKTSDEIRLFAASLLYNLGTLTPAAPDPARLRQAHGHASEALLLANSLNAQAQLMLVACHLQLGENTAAAELLEVLAARDPANATTWSQLQALYLAAAAETKDPAEAARLNLRAYHTLERAQARGHLATPRDHYTQVAILFNLQQYARAAALLEKGLVDGTLENTKRHWELLASAYQQLHRDDDAIDTLERAVRAFPADGPLEFSLAQSLYAGGRAADAYDHARSALDKPGLEKPGQVNIYLAFLAYELKRHDEAARWVEGARTAGDVPASTLDPLARAIADARHDRAALSSQPGQTTPATTPVP